jgi:glucose/arabinose dehydrogenase
MRRLALLLGTVVLVAGCGGEADTGPFKTSSRGPDPAVASPAQPSQTPSGSSSPTGTEATGRPRVVGTVAARLATPWGIAFLPDDSALVTERDSGRVLHIADGRVTQVGDVDETSAQGESGLLGIAVSPSYARNRAVFAYVTTDRDNRVVRMTFDGTRLSAPKPILTGIPNGFIHDGGRLQFAPDGNLFVSTGETGNRSLAQDPDSLGGKILRVTERGKPAPGNPDPGSPIWTIGHRNVQGLAFDDQGNLWASEFGDNTFDELNLIQKGNNYGWPEVEGKGDQNRYRNPQVVWSTDQASPSGLAFLDGHLWLGALRGNRLWRIDVEGQRASAPTDFFVGVYGRIRTVVAAPDGNLWVTTSNRDGRGDPAPRDDRILLVRTGR